MWVDDYLLSGACPPAFASVYHLLHVHSKELP